MMISWFEKVVRPHWRRLAWFLLLSVLLVFLVFRYYHGSRLERAVGYQRLDAAGSVEELRLVAADYADQQVGTLALLRMGRIFLHDEGDYSQAATVFEEAASTAVEERHRLPARLGLAHALEALGEHRRARDLFVLITEGKEADNTVLTSAWCGVGRNSIALEEMDRAVNAFENALQLTEQGPYAEQARQFLLDIEAGTAVL